MICILMDLQCRIFFYVGGVNVSRDWQAKINEKNRTLILLLTRMLRVEY